MEKTKTTKKSKKEKEDQLKYIFGYKDAEDVAQSIWKSSANNLLRGDLIFAYQDSGKDNGLYQFIVVHNFYIDQGNKIYTTYGLTMKTSTWSCIIPHVTIDYLKTVLLEDIKSYKLNKKVIDNFSLILENLTQNGN